MGIADEREDHLRRALRYLELCASSCLDRCFGALADRLEGLEVDNFVGVQRLLVLDAGEHGEVDGVVVVCA